MVISYKFLVISCVSVSVSRPPLWGGMGGASKKIPAFDRDPAILLQMHISPGISV